jgi:hypothetical protein
VHFQDGEQMTAETGLSDNHVNFGKNEGLLASRSSMESIGDRITRNITNHNVIGTSILGFSHPTSGVPDEIW